MMIFRATILFVCSAFFPGFGSQSLAGGVATCPRVTHADLLKMQVPGRPLTIKFFASWCGSCKDDLEGLSGQPARDDLVLLSTFDEESAAVATLKHFNVRQDCRGGDEIARKLGVSHLPRSFRLENGKFDEITLASGAAARIPVRKGKS